ncbi:hypothetical protein Glove_33g307 [Diversispora epigaea]|uniref:Uncharacterized protein n=1 Tax=Diversispora epigaea TaxID=1348612 RepID=A0A397JJS0_9GLOM|nr:hypothetical protein Glove_33g307 [Diversispora epigaea]
MLNPKTESIKINDEEIRKIMKVKKKKLEEEHSGGHLMDEQTPEVLSGGKYKKAVDNYVKRNNNSKITIQIKEAEEFSKNQTTTDTNYKTHPQIQPTLYAHPSGSTNVYEWSVPNIPRNNLSTYSWPFRKEKMYISFVCVEQECDLTAGLLIIGGIEGYYFCRKRKNEQKNVEIITSDDNLQNICYVEI